MLKRTLIAVITLSGCFAQARLFREGGVSGGGGNVLNPQNPQVILDSEKAEHIVRASSLYARIFFANAEEQYVKGTAPAAVMSVYEKIFENNDVSQVLESVRPHVRDSGPCYDYAYQPVDASVVSPLPDQFCVSSFALSHKVLPESLPIQAAALMAHEYSEVMGLGETEAVIIQKQALQDLEQLALPALDVGNCEHNKINEGK